MTIKDLKDIIDGMDDEDEIRILSNHPCCYEHYKLFKVKSTSITQNLIDPYRKVLILSSIENIPNEYQKN
jgi:hypothetical protein